MSSIQHLGDNVWRVFVTQGITTDGKRRRVSRVVHGTKDDAEMVKARLLLESGDTSQVIPTMTVAHYLTDIWLPSKTDVRRKTLLGYESKVFVHIIPALGDIPLVELKALTVHLWLKRLEGEMSGTSVAHIKSVLSNAMQDAVLFGIIESNPCAGMRVKHADYEPLVLDADGAAAYIEAFHGHECEPIVLTSITAGLRPSEVCALDWSDFDFEEGTVRVHRSIHQYGKDVWFEPPKSRSGKRTVALPVWAVDRLRVIRSVGPLVAQGATRATPDYITSRYKERVEEAGLPWVPLENLRHTHGTFLADSGIDLPVIAARMGHSSYQVTKRYLRPHKVADRRAAAALDVLNVQRTQDSEEANSNTA